MSTSGTAMIRARLTLLGSFQVQLDSGAVLTLPTKKARALLAYLAVRRGRGYPRERLIGLLWGDTSEARARNSLRQTLFCLRKTLPAEPPSLLMEGNSIVLNPAAASVDVTAFEELAAEGTPGALEQAAALYQGDLLAGFSLNVLPFDDWLLGERERLHELAIRTLAKLLAHQSESGETEAAVRTAGRLLILDPMQEAVHRALMRLYALQGRWATALRQYQVCVDLLQRELGVDPEAETKELYKELLQKRRSLSPPNHTLVEQRSPRPRRPRIRSGSPPSVSETPLVGREREVTRLRQALDAAWHGQGQVVVVLGEAGVGKSRLVEEIRAEVARRTGRVLLGRSYGSTQILPFGPWVDAFRRGRVINQAGEVVDLAPTWRAELARLFPELAEPGFQPSADGTDYLRLFEALAQLAAHTAARRPLLVILEDLHWADEMSLRLFSFIGRRIESWPVLLIGTAREEELSDVPALCRALEELKQEHLLVEVGLSPLTRPETVALVRMLMATGSDEAAVAQLGEHVWTASEGNPFMAVEALRALREGEKAQAGGLELPERVNGVIAARLERLTELGRRLATVSAVIGREFEFPLLQRATGLSEREVAEALEELVRRRVLHGIGDRFDFTHDYVREFAYRQALAPHRRFLHRQVGEALEGFYGANLEPHMVALGIHYREARVWDKALAYFRTAGDLAVVRWANREAVACFEEALQALAHLPQNRETLEQAVDLRFRLRNALWPLGELARVFQHLREAQPFVEILGDRCRSGWLSSYLAQYFSITGEQDQAIEHGQRALHIGAALEDVGIQVAANLHLGIAHHALGNYRQVVEVLTRNAVALRDELTFERFGLAIFPSVSSRTCMAWSLAELGNFSEGRARSEEAIQIAEKCDQPLTLINAYLGVGLLRLRQGAVKNAIPPLECALTLCRAREYIIWLPYSTAFLGWGYALSGRLAEGLALLEEAIEHAAAKKILVNYSSWLAWLGDAYLAAGRTDDALRTARCALDVSYRNKKRADTASILRLQGEIASRWDPPAREEAEDYYRRSAALAEELGMRPLLAHCHLGLGRLHTCTRGSVQASEHLTTAAAMYRDMGMSLWLEYADAVLAEPADDFGPSPGST